MNAFDAPPEDKLAFGKKPYPVRRMVGAALLILSLLLAIYLLVAYLGWQSGQAQLMENQQTELTKLVERQIELAQENITQGSYSLAMRRLEWVLERSPGNARATELLQQAQNALQIALTPAMVVASPTATATPYPSPTPGAISDPQQELQRIRRLITDETWEDAARALVSFQLQYPNYERQETNRLLYDAYLNLGLQFVEGEQVELGLYYLRLAENLGDLPQEAEDYRLWANWYLQGIGFYAVNWEVAVRYFRDLCLVAPFYQDSCDLLYTALVALGDQYAAAGEWCPAQGYYQEANAQRRNVALAEKIETAVTNCTNATPTPETITNTLPFTQTQQFLPPFYETPEAIVPKRP